MPRLRRRVKRTRQRTVTYGMLSHLECGIDFLSGAPSGVGGFGKNPDREAMREAWDACRDQLIAETIQSRRSDQGPGHRPDIVRAVEIEPRDFLPVRRQHLAGEGKQCRQQLDRKLFHDP